jgi:hypothetical protein
MQQYALTGGLFRLEVQPRSPWIGIAPAALGLRRYASVTFVEAQAGGTKDPANEVAALEANDVLIVRGDADDVRRLPSDKGLAVRSASIEEADDRLFPPERGVAEIIIPPRSPLI